MCETLQWLSCASDGKLSPAQDGRSLHFATPPYSITLDWYENPSKAIDSNAMSYWPEPHEAHIAASDVVYAEVALLNLLCSNRNGLFRALGAGFSFACDLDHERVHALGSALLRGSAVDVEW